LKIYMDACCYNRPMDDQNQDRVYMESEAIKAILLKCEQNFWTLFGSNVLEYELNNNPDFERKQKTFILYNCVKEKYNLSDDMKLRANEFEKTGIAAFDSMHLAIAEHSKADILLTVDDKFIRLSGKTNAKIKVMNPVKWLMEVLEYE